MWKSIWFIVPYVPPHRLEVWEENLINLLRELYQKSQLRTILPSIPHILTLLHQVLAHPFSQMLLESLQGVGNQKCILTGHSRKKLFVLTCESMEPAHCWTGISEGKHLSLPDRQNCVIKKCFHFKVECNISKREQYLAMVEHLIERSKPISQGALSVAIVASSKE
jgi:hypothetical protein